MTKIDTNIAALKSLHHLQRNEKIIQRQLNDCRLVNVLITRVTMPLERQLLTA